MRWPTQHQALALIPYGVLCVCGIVLEWPVSASLVATACLCYADIHSYRHGLDSGCEIAHKVFSDWLREKYAKSLVR